MPILVVDDNNLVRDLLCDFLGVDYDVKCVPTPAEALKLVETEDVPLALIDVALPGINGFELSQRLYSIRPDIPVVLMSGYADLEASAMARPNVAAFLKKPFSLDELEQITSRLLKSGQ